MLRVLALTLAALLLPAALAGAQPAVGLSDQQTATWSHPWVRALGLRHARLIVGWDAASRQTATVDAWLAAVAAAGMEPHVAFEHRRGEDCSSGPCTLPTTAQYGTAVAAFRARWPRVRTFTAWNEANHVSQPTASRPEPAAAYYRELVSRCAGCTVVAGDVLDSGDYATWLRRYLAASPSAPQLWGLHNYGDVTYGGSSGTDTVLGIVPGRLWIEETGGIVTIRNAAGRVTLDTDEARAARAVQTAFAIARARPRIERMYFYHWRAGATERFDAGLVRANGSMRPSLLALAQGLGMFPARLTAGTATVRWSARWGAKRRTILLRRSCAPAGAVCSGRLRAALRITTAARTRRVAFRSRKLGTASALRVAVPPSARAAVARGRARRLRLVLTTTLSGSASSQAQTLTLAR